MNNQIVFPSLDEFIAQTHEQQSPAQTAIESVSVVENIFPTIQADSLDINKRKELGTACAQLYIASQGLCQKTSDAACEIAQSKIDDVWFRYGFNERMSKSDYSVRLELRDRQR